MTRLLTLVALALAMAFAPTPGEAASKRIHVIAKVAQQTFTGNLASPKLGDRIINNVELFDDSDTKVGAGAGVCTIVSIQKSPPDTLVQYLLSAVFDRQIIFGGSAPLKPVPWDISAFLAAQTPFAKPAVTRHSSCYPTETPTPSLTLSNHTRDSTDFLKLSFMARQPDRNLIE